MIIQSKVVSMIPLLKKYLEFLYPQEFHNLYNKIIDKIGDPIHCERRKFDQGDILLITYPHQIQDSKGKKHKPLALLSNFYNHHLSECFSGIHLLPFFPSTSDGGFAVSEYKKVACDYGSWDEIASIKGDLMFDGVFNHTSSKHPWFLAFLNNNPEYENHFHHFEATEVSKPEICQNLQRVTRPRTSELLTEFIKSDHRKTFVWTTFGPDQVDLNFSNPKVFLDIIDTLLFYVENKMSYLRVDAVPFLWKELGTHCVHHEKTHILVKAFRAILDIKNPKVCLITESNVPHEENISYLDNGINEAQLVYNFTFAPLILYSLVNQSSHLLKKWIKQLKPLPKGTYFFNFTATHDGIGVRPLEGIMQPELISAFTNKMKEKGGLINYRTVNGTNTPYEINITWSSALSENDKDLHLRKILCSYSMCLVFPGIPGVYFHNLFGTENWLEGYLSTNHNRDINRRMFSYDEIKDFIKKPNFENRVFEKTTEMLKIRKENEIFHPDAEFIPLPTSDNLWVVERRWKNKKALFIHNLTHQTQTYEGIKLQAYEHLWQLN